MANEDRRKLFNAINQAGYDIGNYDDFDKRMNNAEDRQSFFKAVNDAGYDIGDQEEFERRISPSKYKIRVNNNDVQVSEREYLDFLRRNPSGRTTTPNTSTPEETVDNARQTAYQSKQLGNRIAYNQQRMKKMGLDLPQDNFGRVNLGESVNLMKGNQRYNLESGKMEDTYITQQGNEYENLSLADMEQQEIDAYTRDRRWEEEHPEESLMGRIDSQIADLQQKRDKAYLEAVEKYRQQNEPQSEIGKTIKGIFTSDRPNALGNRDMASKAALNDRSVAALDVALRDLQEAKTMMERNRELSKSSDILGGVGIPFTKDWFNNWKNFGYGVWDAIDDIAFNFSGMNDVQKAGIYLDIRDKIDRGEELTDQETDMALAGMSLAQAEQLADLPTGYTAGQTTAEMAPFMLQMAANPADGFSKAFARKAVRKYGRDGIKAVAARVAARVAGNIGEAAILSNTFQAGKTLADISQRYTGSQFAMDDDGNIVMGHYEKDDNGEDVFVESGDDLSSAILKGEAASIIENFTELGAGGSINGILKKAATRELGKMLGLGYISNLVTKIGSTPFAKSMKHFMEATHWDGMIEEPLEEEYGIILNSILTGDNQISDLWDSKKQADIFAGTMWFGGMMAVMNTTAYPFARRNIKRQLNTADVNGEMAFGDEWPVMKASIESLDDDKVADFLYGIKDDSNFNNEQKAAMFDYAARLKQYQGANVADMLMRMEGNLTPAEAALKGAYDTGADIENPDDKKQVVDEANTAEQELSQYGEEFAKMITSSQDPFDTIDYLLDNREYYSDDQIIAATNYFQKQAMADGMMDAALDNVDLEVRRANNEVISNTHQETGKVINALHDGRPYYVVGGDVLIDPVTGDIQLQGTGGAMVVKDAETGETSVMSPTELSVNYAITAEHLITANETELRQQLMQQADEEITFGSPANEVYQLEDMVSLSDGQGNVVEGQIGMVPNAVDGVYVVYTNDGKALQMTADELNRRIVAHNGMEVQRASQPAVAQNQPGMEQNQAEIEQNQANVEQNQPEPEQQQPQSALSRIPVLQDEQGQPVLNKKGKPTYQWHKASVEDAAAALVETTGGNMLTARDTASDLVKQGQQKLEKIRKQQPKGEDPIEMAESRMEIQRQADEQSQIVKQWQDVGAYIQKQMRDEQQRIEAEREAAKSEEQKAREAEEKRQLEEQRRAIDEERRRKKVEEEIANWNKPYAPLAKARKELAGDPDALAILDDVEPRSLEEWISASIRPKSMMWDDEEIGGRTVVGLQSELGLQKKDIERIGSLIAPISKGGKPFGAIVHEIWEDLPEGMRNMYSDQDVRNTLISMFGSNDALTMRHLAEENRIAEARAMAAENDRRAAEAEMDAWAESYHLNPEEREAYNEWMQQPPTESEQEIINNIIYDKSYSRDLEEGTEPVSRGNAPGTNRGESQVQQAAQAADNGNNEAGTEQRAEAEGSQPSATDNNVPGTELELVPVEAETVLEGVIPQPEVDKPRFKKLRQNLIDAYSALMDKGGHDPDDAKAVRDAAKEIQRYVDEGLDSYSPKEQEYYDEVVEYNGDDAEKLADQYITRVFLDRYCDDDEDRLYILHGLKPSMREKYKMLSHNGKQFEVNNCGVCINPNVIKQHKDKNRPYIGWEISTALSERGWVGAPKIDYATGGWSGPVTAGWNDKYFETEEECQAYWAQRIIDYLTRGDGKSDKNMAKYIASLQNVIDKVKKPEQPKPTASAVIDEDEGTSEKAPDGKVFNFDENGVCTNPNPLQIGGDKFNFTVTTAYNGKGWIGKSLVSDRLNFDKPADINKEDTPVFNTEEECRAHYAQEAIDELKKTYDGKQELLLIKALRKMASTAKQAEEPEVEAEQPKKDGNQQELVPAGTIMKNNIAGGDAVVKIVGSQVDNKTGERRYLVEFYSNVQDVGKIALADSLITQENMQKHLEKGDLTSLEQPKQESAKPKQNAWWNDPNRPVSIDKNNYETYTTDEAKAYFANFVSEDGKIDFTDFAHPDLAYITAAVRDGVELPGEYLRSLSQIINAEDKVKATMANGGLAITKIERDALAKRLINSRPARQERKAIIVVGLPAGGKSSVFANPLAEKFGARIIDSDDVKPWLPGYDGGNGAGYVQDASSEIAERAVDLSVKNGDNILLPRIGGESVYDLALVLRLSGYDVQLYFNDVKGVTSIDRAASRFAQTGRYLSLDYLTKKAHVPSKNFSKFAEKTIGEYLNERGKKELQDVRGRLEGIQGQLSESGARFWESLRANQGRNGTSDETVQSSLGSGELYDGGNGVQILLTEPLFSYAEWKSNDVPFGEKPKEIWNSNSGKTLNVTSKDEENAELRGQGLHGERREASQETGQTSGRAKSSRAGSSTKNDRNLSARPTGSVKQHNRLVSDDKMEELKKRLIEKLGSQLNAGIDPELMIIGGTYAVGKIERGFTKFVDYATEMVNELGDFIRPYLKAFYETVRQMPGSEEYRDQMDSQEYVNNFDVLNFDKSGKVVDPITKAEHVVREQRVKKQAKKIKQEQPDLFAGDLFADMLEPEQKQKPIGKTSDIYEREAEEAKVNTNPTEGQKKAGNYKMGHIKVDGFDISIENPKGSTRSGVDQDGKEWSQEMHNNYGYIRRTEGVDGDHIDVFLSDNPEEGYIYVVDQVNPKTGKFDEHKILYGFDSIEEAKKAYLSNYEKGWKGLGDITRVEREDFKKWIDSSHRKTKPYAEYAEVKKQRAASYNEDGVLLANATDADIDRNDAQFYYQGKPVNIMLVTRSGEQVSATQFSKPKIESVTLTNGKNVKVNDLMVKVDEKPAEETVESKPQPKSKPAPMHNNKRNNVGERGKDYAPGTLKARFNANIEAIKLMRALVEDGVEAPTKDQMEALRQYSGWGGMGTYFNDENSEENKILRDLLSEEEYNDAAMSINSAYYTPAMVIDTLWDIADAMGFKGGNVLEGSAGIGNIIGQMPTDMSRRSNIEAVEIDSISGNILKLLYPDAKVHIQGFQDTMIPNGSVDLAITNVPFVTGLHVIDKVDKDLSRKFKNIHDFCIAKNIRKLREGGIGLFITSSGTLDKSTELRAWITDEGQADVVGAFRLNNETFKGTTVTSDIIVVRKRANNQKSPNAIEIGMASPLRVGSYEDKYGTEHQVSMVINDYFKEHPEMMAGEMAFAYEKGETFRPGSYGLYPVNSKDQDKMLADFAKSMSKAKEVVTQPKQDVLEEPNQLTTIKEGRMLVDDKGRLCVSRYGTAVPLQLNDNKIKGKYTKEECFKDYQAVQKAVDDVLQQQLNSPDDEALKPKIKALNKAFDNFVKKYGELYKNMAISFLRNDIDYPSFQALVDYKVTKDMKGKETVSQVKMPIFSERVLGFKTEPKPKTVKDALIASIFMNNGINLSWIAEKLNDAGVKTPDNGQWTEDDVKNGIIVSRLGFEDPSTGQMVVYYKYLSGNVREKLSIAESYNTDGKYNTNVEELRKVVPMDIPAHLIDFSLGSSWIPMELYQGFFKEKFEVTGKLTKVEGSWILEDKWYNNETNRAAGVYSEKFRETIYGHQIAMAAFNNRPIKVQKQEKIGWGKDASTKTVTDKAATQACAVRMDEIKDEFREWVKKKVQENPDLAHRLEKIYNDKFNALVPMNVDEEFMPEQFEGANINIKLYDYQRAGVLRGLTAPTMLAHVVGAGKSFTLITTAMEMRRLGTARKPMVVVQNATVAQMAADAKLLYPNAKVLSLQEKDRDAEGRRAFYASIKYNDWDLIIIPQSTFERIPDSPERELQFIQEKIDEKKHVIEAARAAGADSRAMRKLEKELEKIEQEYGDKYLDSDPNNGGKTTKRKKKDSKREAAAMDKAKTRAKEMLDRATDDVQTFDDLGVDALLIDEAHEYKHLGFQTSIERGIKGVDPSYSKKCAGLYNKTRAIFEKSGWKNVVFATGTPISNTAAEIWTFMKYLMPADVMQANDIYYFDDFVHNFGAITQMLEFTTSGKFKENTRFASYMNRPELLRIWMQVAHIVNKSDLGTVADKLPKKEGGKDQDVFLPQSPSLINIMAAVREELERFENMDGKEKKENSHIPLTMYGVAKRAAIDPRLVNADAADEPQSKTNAAVAEILKDLKATKSYKGTVAVFCDNQNRKNDDGSVAFNIYDDIKQKLIKAGVPEKQIAIIKSGMSIPAKQKVFDAVNAGEIRVVLGSTQTLGTGVNMQERLHLLIHMDAPDRPMDYTQRNGRIERQGNLHKDWDKPIRIVRFGVEDSLDVTAYQRLKTKSGFIDSIMDGKSALANNQVDRTVEEEEDGLFDNPVAVLSGSQYALLKNKAERDLRKYQGKKAQWEADQIYIANALRQYNSINAAAEETIEREQKDLENIKRLFPDGKVKTINVEGTDVDMTKGNESVGVLSKVIKEKINDPVNAEAKRLRESKYDEHNELDFTIKLDGHPIEFKVKLNPSSEWDGSKMRTVIHMWTSFNSPELHIQAKDSTTRVKDFLDDILDEVITGQDFTDRIDAAKAGIERRNAEMAQMKEREGKPFEFSKELEEAEKQVEEYTELMKKEMEEKEAKYAAQKTEKVDLSNAEDSEDDNLYRMADEDEESFKSFFGDWENDPANASKVIDENGQPLVVYRGGKPFDEATIDNASSNAMYGKAFYATPSIGGAEEYAIERTGDKNNVQAVYINVRKPFVDGYVDGFNHPKPASDEEIKTLVEALAKKGLKEPKTFLYKLNSGRIQGSILGHLANEEFEGVDRTNGTFWPAADIIQDTLKELGYDGVIGMYTGEAFRMPQVAAFDMSQVREVDTAMFREQDQFIEGQLFPITKQTTQSGYNVLGQRSMYSTALMPDTYPTEAQLLYAVRMQYPAYYATIEDGNIKMQSWHTVMAEAREAQTIRGTKGTESYVERKTRQAIDAVNDLANRMHLDVEVLTTTDGLTEKQKRKKGWFNPKTHKIVIVLPNHVNKSDVINTLLHEGVAHYGLRKMFGEAFETFLDNVYDNADEQIRATIDASIKKKGWSRHEATEEYLARLAERTDFENAQRRGWWQKIKEFFLDMLAKAGFNTTLTDNELRYILWRSYDNLLHPGTRRDIFDKARDVMMQSRLKVGNYAEQTYKPTGELQQAAEEKSSETQNDEVSDIVYNAMKRGTFMKAPNGKPTNLSEDQWSLVRTNAFKNWFGDWENDPENASKVVDENGEPKVMYHGTNLANVNQGEPFWTFHPDSHFGTKGQAQAKAEDIWNPGVTKIYEVFLNIRNPQRRRDADMEELAYKEMTFREFWEQGVERAKGKGHDGIVYLNEYEDKEHPADSWIAFNPNQVKSATDNNGEFSTENDDIRYRDDSDIAQEEYNEQVAKKSLRWQEAWQDSMIGLKAIQDAIAKETGNVATGAEDAYRFENRMHGRAKNMTEQYDWRFYRPMLKAFSDFCKKHSLTQQQGLEYLISKSGLERNVYYAFRNAMKQKVAEDVNAEREKLEKDYAKNKIDEVTYKKLKEALEEKQRTGVDDEMQKVKELLVYKRAKEDYEKGDIGFTEYLRRIEQVIAAHTGGHYDDYAHDYSGLTETFAKDMYDEAQKIKKEAQRTIDPTEKRKLWSEYDHLMRQAYEEARLFAEDAVFSGETDLEDTNKLWNAINAATKETLKTSYESGLIDRKGYDKVRDMFDYYIPLRGWDENKAADVYTYMGKDNVFSPAVKKTWGRTSKAENPLAYIGNIAVSTILSGHRNQLKQHFLNYVMNNPTSLVSVSESWYEDIGTEDNPMWILRSADTAGKSADEVAQIVNDFNEEMKQKQAAGLAMPVTGRLRLDVNATKGQKSEHVVEVQRAGHTYQLYINGDPKAAQALNGTNVRAVSRISDTYLGREITRINRAMAMYFTSKNPAFVVSNLSRDLNMAGASVAINEGAEYNARFMANVAKVLTPRLAVGDFGREGIKAVVGKGKGITGMMPKLMAKWKNGKLNTNNETERYFKEFMDEGGETGFVNMLSVDSFKEKMKKEIKEMNGSSLFGDHVKETYAGKGLRILGDTFEFYNRCAEDATRFIVYMTSRQMGKTLEESIADAKDVTLNFNRKGTGDKGNAEVRDLFIFVNPAIQALANMYRMLTGHTLRFGAVTTTFIAGGAIMAVLNQWMLNMWGDDDDKDAYWNLPPWVRKNNLVMWVPGTKNFITIPLAQEFRVFYGMGEMMASAVENHGVHNPGLEIFSSVADLIPINPTGNGGNLMVDFAPTMVQPLMQIGENIDFTGKPIWKENQGNKYAPAYTKAYISTPSYMVKIAEGLNTITGGNEGKQGVVEQYSPIWGNYINNPAVWNHLLQGYFGGMYNTIAKGFDVAVTAASGELPKVYQTPVINRFLNRPVERDNAGALGDEYYKLIEDKDRLKFELRTWKKKAANGEDGAQEHVDEILDSPEWKQAEVIDHYDKIMKDLRAGEKAATEKSDKALIKETISMYKQQLSEELYAISEGKDPIDAALELFAKAKTLAEKKKLYLRIERLTMEKEKTTKDRTKSRDEDLEKALKYVADEEGENKDANSLYLQLATPQNALDDARIKSAKAKIKKYTDEYKRMLDEGQTDAAAKYREANKKWFEADQIVGRQSRTMQRNKKLLGKGQDSAIMKILDSNRKSIINALNKLE